MIRLEIDGKNNYVNTTPLVCFVESERNLTLIKLIVKSGGEIKEYDLCINNNGLAQMK